MMSEPSVQIETLGGSRYRLTASVTLSRPRREVFAFFSNAHNLERITPGFLNFRILTPAPIEMREGAKIDYRIRLHGIPIKWQTRISAWQPNERFVDEQIRGPYRNWHHEHLFDDAGQQTVMTDVVNYGVWLGAFFHPLVVKKDLLRVFQYRQNRIMALFG
jgi:ligand-binding SRPBCC domain-containing protein